MDQLTASAPTRSAAAARRRLARARRRVAAGVAALLSTIGILATVTPLAQAANNCGEGVVTCGTVDKEVVNPKPVYQVGESVTYRLTLQCSSLEGNCGIGTVTDVFDPNLTIPGGAVVLPNPLPYPMTYSWAGNTLTLKLGNATTAWPDGSTSAVDVTAIVKDYPLTAPVGVINNQATLAVTKGSSLNSAIVPINVEKPVKDFGLSKSSASGIAPGETYSFQMKFTRPTRVGGIDVTSAVVTDPLPADLEYVTSWAEYASAGWTTSYDSGSHTVTWNLSSIPARDSLNCDAQGLNCTAYTTLYVTVKVPPNARQSAVPAAGTVYTNTATAVLTYKDGGTETVSASGTLSTAAPNPGVSLVKTGPAKVAPGGKITWRVYAQNTGNMTLTDAVVTDKLPTNTLESLTLERIYWDYNPLAPRGGLVTFQFSSDGGATWGSSTVIDSNVSTPLTIPVPAGSTHWRMSTPALKPGQYLTMYVTATVPADTSLDDTIVNCASMTSTTPGFTAPADKCVTTNVDPAEAFITPIKGLKITGPNAPTSVTPLEVFDWIVGFAVESSIPVKTMTLSDVIPPQFEVIGVTCFSTRGTGSGEGSSVIDAPCPSTRPIPDHTIEVLADGSGTLVSFQDMILPADTLAGQNSIGYSLHIQVRVKPGTSVADYTNTVKVNTNDQVTTCDTSWYVQTETTDPADIDGDGITDELVCTNKAVVKVIEAETVQVRKWDIGDPTLGNIFEATGTTTAPAGADETVCPDWDGYTRYPCVAQTLPGGSFGYRVEMQNVGNVPMTDYVLYDVLPVIGDTGVGQLLSGGQRATEWSPVLTGPVVLDSALSTATNSGYVVEYNLTSNPCRPELNIDPATPDAPWQTSCDDNWLNAGDIVDWTSVKSYRIKLFQQADGTYPEWSAGQTLVFTVPMKAPLNAPQSVFEPLDLSVAWNSVAYRGHRLMAVGEPLWLKPSEPRKVGIVVPFTIPPAVSVGDYFWYDADKDGFQDADELPVKNAVVRLLNADGTEELGATTTNEFGYYSFVNLVPDTDYIIEFVNPDPAAYTFTKQNAGADTSNSRTADLTDSDVAVATGRVWFNSGPAGDNLPGGPTQADAGTDNPGLDAGLIEVVKAVSLGDYVWFDDNRNGLQDSTESPYVGMTVNLLDDTGAPVLDGAGNPRTTTTDANGYYSFTDLTPVTTYIVEFVKLATEGFTTQDVAVNPDDAKDSDADVTTGRVTVTTKDSGANLPTDPTVTGQLADDPTIDAGIVRYNLNITKELTAAESYRPGQTVTYTIVAHNDGPAPALAGWSVTDVLPVGLTLVSMTGEGYDCTTTPGTCVSTATGLAAGQFGNPITVTATIAATATGTLKNVAYVSPSANDGPETIPLVTPTLTTDTTQPNTDNDDEQSLTLLPYVSVGDFVWYDVNRDGQQTAGEPVYVGMTVELYAADGTTKLNSTTTDAGGYYSFTGLDPSTAYVIKFVKKVDETFTTTNQGGITTNSPTGDLSDSDAAQADGTVAFTTTATGSNLASSVTAGVKADNPGIDAGIVRYNLVLDKALTSSGPYYEGGTVTYSLTPSNDGPVDALKGWSVTDILPTGLTLVSMTGTGYDCTTTPGTCVSKDAGLAAGQKGNVITVTATIDANVTGDLKNVAYVSPSQNDGPETIPLVVPDLTTDTTQPNTDNDDEQKITVLSKVSIGDYVWLDVNRDGLQAGEAGIAGVTVTLTDAAGATRSTTTDASGYYWFDDLTPGAAYTLTFTKPTGYVWTTQNVAGDTADKDAGTDSDVNPADGKVSFTAPTSGSNRTGALVTDNPTLDAGLIELVSVGDYTWLDVNRDGIQDAGESPLAGVTVNLYDAAGGLVGTKTTDAAGYYWFTDLLAGATYTIEFVKPAGYTYTPVVNADPTANKDGGLDSDAPVADGKVTFVAEATGSNAAGAKATDNPTIDAGFVELVSLGDYVWFDRNRDGLQGAVADEPVVAGVVVNVYAADGTTLVKTTTTNAAGFYSFTDLLAGATYVVEFVKPADTVFTQANAVGNTEDIKDSDANVSTGRVTVVAPSTGANSATTPDDPTIDAGLIELVSIGDFVWFDRNRDGQQSAGEPAVPGVVVNLTGPDGFSASTTTDASGFYSFNNLIGGVTYTVEFVKPADTIFTSQNTGADATDSDADVTTGKVTVVAPVSGNNSLTAPDDPTIDAGLVELVSVGDYVWWDTNRDGLQDGTDVPLKDVVVHLLDADGNPAVLPGGAPVTATTDAAGAYWFTNLIAGVTYQVKFDTPAQYVATTSNVSGDTSNSATADLTDSDPIAGVVTFTAPVTGDNKAGADVTDNPGLDAGFIKLVSVGDYVWYDANRDGVQSDGELPVEGVVVNLYDKDGKLVDSATTNADGFYSFINLLAGATYTIEFVKPDNTIFTAAEAGAKDVDSNADVVFGKYTFPAPTDGLNSATTPDDPTIDAGLIELVSIGDYVWWDRDLDGLQSEGEPVVAGVTVNLMDADGNPAVLPGGAPVTTTTNAAGFYSFTNLVAGVTYQVQFVKPADTIFTSQDVEGDVSNDTTTDVADSDAHEVTGLVTVVAPATGTNSATDPDNPTIDAGLIELVSVGNYVWLDINRDGLQSEGEPVVAGVTVNLLDAEGNPAVLPGDASVTTVTDENGYYAFNNLIGGVTYRIEFVTPEGKVLTFQDVEGDTSNSIETDVADSDADQLTGLVEFVAPVTGDNLIDPMLVDNPTIDAGLVTLVSVGDYVWYDVDRDGVQDEGEAPVPGVTVNLYDEDGELLATATTDENGFYSFTDLWAGATYTIEFVKPAGTSFTSMGAGEDDTVDSNADVVSGAYTFQAPADGSNSAITPDDPTIDAGLVKYNLNLVKKLVGPRVVNPGDTVTFTLTPHNDGPVNALAGWSVTEVMPEGLTLVSMSGQGYTCTGNVCVASGVLPAGEFGPVVTVTATVTHTYLGLSRNVAYVDRAPGDGDETIPLGPVPAPGTDTDLTATDNDDAAAVIIVPKPTPTTTPTGTVTPTPSPTVTPSPNPTVTPTGTATPTGSVTPSPSPSSTGTDGGSPLPQTGTDSLWVVVGGLLLVAVGGIILVASRRRRSTQE